MKEISDTLSNEGPDGTSFTMRYPVVSGLFYPDDRQELESMVDNYLEEVDTGELYRDITDQTSFSDPEKRPPVVLVVPHAGFIFSGRVQARAYVLLKSHRVDTAIIMGPSHQKRFKGVSIALDDAYSTPIGISRVDQEFSKNLMQRSDIFVENEKAHLSEHVIEVQLPFLQRLSPEIGIVSLLFGDQDPLTVKSLCGALAGTMNALERNYIVIASSDLSHYHTSKDAARLDSAAIQGIMRMEAGEFYDDILSGKAEACGAGAIMAGILLARERGYGKSAILSYIDSGEVSGDRRQVVGYISAVMY
jgi:AmmeMemoRadiSam system protein B